jgi:hypothetical protein
MSQESKEALRRFEQKMREQGADGFADGPRPWEHWDESGHQANNRIWEGSARRIYPGGRRARSLGHRLLSVLAFVALTTLLVGIGGVYLSHTQTRQLAETTAPPLPFTDQQQPAAVAPANEIASAASITRTPDLEALSAPAAGAAALPQLPAAASKPVTADPGSSPVTDVAALATATPLAADSTSGAPPPATASSIDSVAIETIVTEQSVTTTVYTRHPLQDQDEVVAAIETTPPPFVHRMDDTRQQSPDRAPAVSAAADTGISRDATMEGPDADLQRLPIDAPAAFAAQPGALPEKAPAETAEVIAAADTGSAAVVEEPVIEVEVPDSDAADIALTDNLPTVQAETATLTAQVEMNSEMAEAPVADIESAVSDAAITVQKDSPVTEQAGMAASTAPVEMNSETLVTGAQGAAAEVSEDQPVESLPPVTPVAKTGDWVINLASYTRESTANRKLALFQQQGVDAEVFAVTINDKPMYRIRAAGYESSRSAKADIPVMEQKLDLKGVWISRR